MSLKILGQAAPAAGVTTILYSVGVGLQSACNLTACNTDGASSDDIIIYQVKSGDSPGSGNTIHMVNIPAHESFEKVGICVSAGDSVQVVSTNGRITFTLDGDER